MKKSEKSRTGTTARCESEGYESNKEIDPSLGQIHKLIFNQLMRAKSSFR